MSRSADRIVLFGGMLSAFVLVPVGSMMTVFGFGNAVVNWFKFADPEANQWIAVCVLGVTFAINCVPLVLFWFAWWSGPAEQTWLGFTMLLLSPIFVWIGYDSLILQGDWGDFVLWGPYLLTGVFLAAKGGFILMRRYRF